MTASVLKWLGGIGSAVVAGLAVWWLTAEGGPFVPKHKPPPPRTPAPKIVLLDSRIEAPDLSQAYGDRFEGWFTLHNDGDATAENCLLWLIDGGSRRFGLEPGGKRQVHVLTSQLYREPGRVDLYAIVQCDGYERQLYREMHTL
ncbi:hypothetical protein [Litorisediminicola beolgyonensis]|uniref:Uncharacterized protein n=1 Tax=Litorisediminicola beolgyonensis TaxID=1173614 RepID=A0ABW3ZMC2_9RHOB